MKVINDAYIHLAAAIVNSGIKENDQSFLKSDWCKFLTDSVLDYCYKKDFYNINVEHLLLM